MRKVPKTFPNKKRIEIPNKEKIEISKMKTFQ